MGGGDRCVRSSGDVDVGVLVPDKVDVWLGEVLADELPPGVAGLVVPLETSESGLVDEGHAGLRAEAVSTDGAVGLHATARAVLGPVVELKKQTYLFEFLSILP